MSSFTTNGTTNGAAGGPTRREALARAREEGSAVSELEAIRRDHPDLLLISDYLGGALGADEAKSVEERLASDPDFFRLAEPLLHAREVIQAETTRAHSQPYDVVVAWQDLRHKAGLEPLASDTVYSMLSPLMGEASVRAASALPMTIKPVTVFNARARRIAGRTLTFLLQLGGVYMMMSSCVPEEPWGPQWRVVTTTRTEPEALTIDDSTAVTVAPDARFIYKVWGRLTTTPSEVGRREVFLDGGGTFDVRMPYSRRLRIRGPALTVEAQQAAFAIAPSAPCLTRVQVTRGELILMARHHPDDVVFLEGGESAVVGCDGRAIKAPRATASAGAEVAR